MPAPSYSAADYLSLLQSLKPRGRVWPQDPDAQQTRALSGFAPSFARINDRANYLLVDAFPETTTELLPEWEESLGLPDPCAGSSPTIQQRRAQVVARFTDSGGQSAPHFVALAASLGFTVSVTNFAPFRAGFNRAGDPDNGTAWAHTWAINAPLNTVTQFRAGLSAAGEPLGSWGNAVLECELKARAPAHTVLQFRYS